MNLLISLFLTFLKIGAVSFGGGYAMIPIIRDSCLNNGWLTEEQLMDFIAVAESTPGPIAVNMATFVGSSKAGVLGAFFATLGVVLPSFIVILLVAAILTNFLKYKAVGAALKGIRPVIVGLIISTGITMTVSVLFGFKSISDTIFIDVKGFILFILLVGISFLYKRVKSSGISPILLIVVSAVFGIIFYR